MFFNAVEWSFLLNARACVLDQNFLNSFLMYKIYFNLYAFERNSAILEVEIFNIFCSTNGCVLKCTQQI